MPRVKPAVERFHRLDLPGQMINLLPQACFHLSNLQPQRPVGNFSGPEERERADRDRQNFSGN